METIVKGAHPQNKADGNHRKLYEAMFLVDSAKVSDWDGEEKVASQPPDGQVVITAIETILEKADARIVSMKKWDERKLAYAIDHKTRGTYILVFFTADGERIRDIERDVQLSEQIMRVLVLNAEQQVVEDTEEQPAKEASEAKAKEVSEAETKEASELAN